MEQIVASVHGSGRSCLALHPSKDYLYIGGSEGLVKQYSYGLQGKSLSLTSTLSEADQRHDEAIHEICWSASGDKFALCSEDGEVVLLRHPSCSVQSVLGKYDSSASSISFDRSSKYSFLLAMSSEAGRVKIVNALDATTKFFEFECTADGVRNIRFVPFKPDPLRASREKYLAVAQCDGALSLWKILTLNVHEQQKPAEEKVVRAHSFDGVFPKIKGGDSNQRLDFDSTHDGALMALPGHNAVKMLETKTMQMAKTECIVHECATNCCAFKPKSDTDADTEGSYTLAVSDVKGNVSVWSVQYTAEGSLQCSSIERIVVGEAVCSLVWRNEALIASSMQGNLFKYTLRGAADSQATAAVADKEAADKENTDSNVVEPVSVAVSGGMDVDNETETAVDATESDAKAPETVAVAVTEPTEPTEEKKMDVIEVEQTAQPTPAVVAMASEYDTPAVVAVASEAESNDKKEKATKSKFEEDSDEDFDIDMDDGASTGKKILLKKADSESPSPSPVAETHSESTIAAVSMSASIADSKSKSQQIADELAAAAEMFGDDDDEAFGADIEAEPVRALVAKVEAVTKPKAEAKSFSTDVKQAMEEDVPEDDGEDLGDFVVDDAPKHSHSLDDHDAPMMDEPAPETAPAQQNEEANWSPGMNPRQRPFVNGETPFDDDGQRYLMLCEVGGLIVRKQGASSNPMEKDIINSLNNRRYVYELDVFDKSKYSRAIAIKSDHHFVCAAINEHGLLLGSQPEQPSENDDNEEQPINNDDDIVESVVRYKPILRREEYRPFSSDKDQEWTHRLSIGEECVACALTPNFVLIATNHNVLRVLTIGGLQAKPVLSFPTPIAHIAGSSHSTANIIAVMFEDLSLCVLDLDTNIRLWHGHCAVTSPDAYVTRLFLSGDAKDFKVVSVDSENSMAWLDVTMFGGAAWTLILDIDEHVKRVHCESEIVPKGVWPVFFDAEEQCLMVLELAHVDHPLPAQSSGSGGLVLSSYALSVPLMGVESQNEDASGQSVLTFGAREEKIMTGAIERKMCSVKSVKERKTATKQLLKDYLMLFGHACSANRSVVAYDIAKHFLDTEKAMSSAIKAAMRCQLPMLAEQLTNVAKERLAQKEKEREMKVQAHTPTMAQKQQSASGVQKPSQPSQPRSIKKPSRSVGMLKRPTAKLGGSRKSSEVNDVTHGMQRTQLIGKKRAGNPCGGDRSNEPPKKRGHTQPANPFSCADKKNSTNQKSKKSVFASEFN